MYTPSPKTAQLYFSPTLQKVESGLRSKVMWGHNIVADRAGASNPLPPQPIPTLKHT